LPWSAAALQCQLLRSFSVGWVERRNRTMSDFAAKPIM
jgi:hypothetical protein